MDGVEEGREEEETEEGRELEVERMTFHSASSHFHSVVRLRREVGSDLMGDGV